MFAYESSAIDRARTFSVAILTIATRSFQERLTDVHRWTFAAIDRARSFSVAIWTIGTRSVYDHSTNVIVLVRSFAGGLWSIMFWVGKQQNAELPCFAELPSIFERMKLTKTANIVLLPTDTATCWKRILMNTETTSYKLSGFSFDFCSKFTIFLHQIWVSSNFCTFYLKTEYVSGFLVYENLQKHILIKFLPCLVKKIEHKYISGRWWQSSWIFPLWGLIGHFWAGHTADLGSAPFNSAPPPKKKLCDKLALFTFSTLNMHNFLNSA